MFDENVNEEFDGSVEEVITDDIDVEELDLFGEEPDEIEEAGEPQDEQAEEGNAENHPKDNEQDLPKFTLKVNGELKEVTQDEIIPLAQMGMDYNRIREQRDQALNAPELAMLDQMAQRFGMNSRMEFLQGFYNQIEEQRAYERANQLMLERGIDEESALYMAKLEQGQENAEFQQRMQQSQSQAQNHQRQAQEEAYNQRVQERVQGFQRLYENYPELKDKMASFDDFPQTVKEMVMQGASPLEAYQKHLIDERNKEMQIIKNNGNVKKRSTGSAKGAEGNQRDPFLAGLFGDD